ncbi:MAG: transporter [Halioglobus sp.]|nr:transporter [Halioglobus sp.]|tara:strand:+ start:3966 stop:4628 length:663 start_codon:yes stop_codon:yes gene_type:complete
MPKIHSHNNFFVFTGALVALLVCSGLITSTPAGDYHMALQLAMIGTEIVAYFSLSLTRRWRRFVIIILAITLAANVFKESSSWSFAPVTVLLAYLVFLVGMTIAATRQAIFTGCIELNTIAGAVGVYLLLGLVWTVLYLLSMEAWPQAIHGIEYRPWHENMGKMVYFSYVTMTTLGYGDISPAIPFTRVLAALQAVTGTFYMAVVVASLVGALSEHAKKP